MQTKKAASLKAESRMKDILSSVNVKLKEMLADAKLLDIFTASELKELLSDAKLMTDARLEKMLASDDLTDSQLKVVLTEVLTVKLENAMTNSELLVLPDARTLN